jgi:hypothetical protein
MQVIKIIVYAVIVAVIAVLSVLCQQQKQHIKTLKMQVEDLKNRRMTVFDVQLHVTDKSTNKINGSHNKGTITMPQERVYKLEIDSTNITIK